MKYLLLNKNMCFIFEQFFQLVWFLPIFAHQHSSSRAKNGDTWKIYLVTIENEVISKNVLEFVACIVYIVLIYDGNYALSQHHF